MKPLRFFLLLFIFSILIVSGLFLLPKTGRGEQILDIKPGDSLHSLSKQLYNKGVIEYPAVFQRLAQLSRLEKFLRPGRYLISHQKNYFELITLFFRGKQKKIPLTIPEGFNIYQLADRIERLGLGTREEVLSLCLNSNWTQFILKEKISRLEGYLFPDTYFFYKYDGEKKIISKILKKFVVTYNEIWNKHKFKIKKHSVLKKFFKYPDRFQFNRQSVITLASIIERETGEASERPIIASVFFNRLFKRMKLQSDPTILYGMWADNRFVNNIRKKDILEYTPYNTYRVPALPRGPISNPGRQAIESVFNPASTSYFYFVSRNDGSHVFTKTYSEHVKYVNILQRKIKPKKAKKKTRRSQ